jgi:serine/threonine protein kinase
MVDLCQFGWDGCIIPTNLKEVCKHLPSWRHLKTLRPLQSYEGTDIYFTWKYIKDKHGGQFVPAYLKGILDDDGGYAFIYKGRRAMFRPAQDQSKANGAVKLEKYTHFGEICIKEVRLNITPEEDAAPKELREQAYNDEINAILYEAFIHALLAKTMEGAGHSSTIPRLYEIVAHTRGKQYPAGPTDFESIWIIMEFLEGMTLEKFLEHNLKVGEFKQNEKILLDVCIQLAAYLQILQEKTRFNHRDLKINNLFVRKHSAGWNRRITIPEFGSWVCTHDIVMIDFGFSCIACGNGYANPRATLVGAGSWFESHHDCFKKGRDLCQFLYSVHCTFPLQNYVTTRFFQILHTALQAKHGGTSQTIDLLYGTQPNGDPKPQVGQLPPRIDFNDGIYIFLRDNNIDVPGCEPKVLLQNIKTLL